MNRLTIVATLLTTVAALTLAATAWAQEAQSPAPNLIPNIKQLNLERASLTGTIRRAQGEFARGSTLLTPRDIRMQQSATRRALAYVKAGGEAEWHNAASGNSGVIKPTDDYKVGDTSCRDLTVIVKTDSRDTTTRFVGCRQQSGVWTMR